MKQEENLSNSERLEELPVIQVAYTGANKGALGVSGYAQPLKIEKDWGYELIYQNNQLYCCKLLFIDSNKSCSYHLHLTKHETLLVVDGVLQVDTTHNKIKKNYQVNKGEAFVIAPGFIHSLRAASASVTLIESSTPSYDTDSIRIAKGS